MVCTAVELLQKKKSVSSAVYIYKGYFFLNQNYKLKYKLTSFKVTQFYNPNYIETEAEGIF